MKTKRLLSGLITVAMLLSLCVTTAFAANSGYKAGLTVSKVDDSTLSVSCDAGPSGASVNIQGVQTFIVAYDLEILKPLLKNKTTFELTTSYASKKIVYEGWSDPATLEEWFAGANVWKSADNKVGFALIQPASTDLSSSSAVTLTEVVSLAKFYLGFQTGKSYADVKEDTVRFATAAELKGMSEDKAIRFNDGTDANGFEWSNGGTGDTLTFAPGNEPKVEAKGFTFAGTAAPVTLSSIAVKTAPTKVTYNEGESFDATGMVIEATYSDTSKKDVTTYTYAPTVALTTSDTEVTISYTEGGVTKTCTQAITVNAVTPPATKTLTGIAVKTVPTKVDYNEGDSFDKTGMVIEATYSDTSTAAVTTYTYTPTGALTTSDTEVTISYTEGGVTKTCTQAITVNAVTPPAPTEYTITFNGNGGTPSVGTMSTAGGKLTSLPTATRSGSYSFDGWYTAASGGTQITTAYVFSANTTVYAHWTYTGGGGGSYYAPVVPDMPMLHRGCTGDAVKTLQEKLNAKGFHSGNVDGIFGCKTYAAVTAFQKANGLGVDGIVGKLTWAKLYDATPVNVTPVTTQPMLRTGSRGDAVRKLQELLNAKGYTCGNVDGIFGSKTYAAVLAFQKANGLGADGIVGPLTWGKLV